MDALYIRTAFTRFIESKTKQKPTQRDFLLNHERRRLAEENVMQEVKMASIKWGARGTKKDMDALILVGATIFCDCALAAKIRELMTDAELKRQETAAGELADTQNMVDSWKAEAESTAVSKAMPATRLEDVQGTQKGVGDEHRLGGSERDGPALRSPDGHNPVAGTD